MSANTDGKHGGGRAHLTGGALTHLRALNIIKTESADERQAQDRQGFPCEGSSFRRRIMQRHRRQAANRASKGVYA